MATTLSTSIAQLHTDARSSSQSWLPGPTVGKSHSTSLSLSGNLHALSMIRRAGWRTAASVFQALSSQTKAPLSMTCAPAVPPLTSVVPPLGSPSHVVCQPLPRARVAPLGAAPRGSITAAATVAEPVRRVGPPRRSSDNLIKRLELSTSVQKSEHAKSNEQATQPEQQRQQTSTAASTTRAARSTARKLKEASSKDESATDLRNVHGVGPKNEQLLLKSGLSNVASLKAMYKTEHNESTNALKQFLQGTVGIRSHHCTVIATDIKHKVDQEVMEAGGPSTTGRSKRVTLCVEGNISAGKSTFLKWVSQGHPELADLLEVVPEPVDKWQDVGNGHHNVLEAFYKSPERYAYTFQNYVFVTRMMQERDTQGGERPFRLLERSVFSDRMVFVKAVHEKQWMSDLELNLYDSWFEPVVQASPTLVPDGFIYLRATPDICMGRMKRRSRAEEVGVQMEYLQGLHQKHEDWLRFPPATAAADWRNPAGISLPSALKGAQHDLRLRAVKEPRAIEGKVLYLNSSSSPGMPKFIDGVPTLVLDYDKDIDMVNDHAARNEYASQVMAYFDFVKDLRNKKQEDLHLSAITGELPLGNIQKASIEQVQAVQNALSVQGHPLSAEQLEVMRHSLADVMYESGMQMPAKPVLAGAF